MRDWARARRERTRHFVELGGLVQEAALVEPTDDDRVTVCIVADGLINLPFH